MITTSVSCRTAHTEKLFCNGLILMATDKRNYNYQNSTLNRDRKLEIIMRHQKKKKKKKKYKKENNCHFSFAIRNIYGWLLLQVESLCNAFSYFLVLWVILFLHFLRQKLNRLNYLYLYIHNVFRKHLWHLTLIFILFILNCHCDILKFILDL